LTDDQVAAARAALPALETLLQVNAGTKGLTAGPVIEALKTLTDDVEYGGYAGYNRVQQKAAAARDRLADFLGAERSALAFTGNATESLNVALMLPWRTWQEAQRGGPVDVLISDHEYPTTNLLFGYLTQLGLARLIRYPLSADPDALMDAIAAAATPGTQAIVASHVDCNTGLRIDPAPLVRWARERGIVSFIDGAQAAGQFPLHLAELGADLYITNGHKWLFGPNGVGLLYVRPGFERTLIPQRVGSGTMHFDSTLAYAGEPRWTDGARRFELLATRPAQVFAAMDAALDWHAHFGDGAIERRQRALTERIKQRLLQMPERYRLITPLAWEASSALASVQILENGTPIGGDRIGAFCGRMLTAGHAFIRPVPEFDALRLSMAYYNTDDDFERLFELLRAL
jgi:L-cysteine/cystine lyase